MNVPELQKLVEQYRTDKSVIFLMDSYRSLVECGTAFCIAGQTAANAGEYFHPCGCCLTRGEPTSRFAQRALGLTAEQKDRLFFKENWPKQFQALPDTPALAADRIQHFIDTKGAE